jgi:phenylacetate-CoA ligase
VEYEIVVTRPSMMDEILLRFETDSAIASHQCEGLKHSLQQHLKVRTNLRFEMELCRCGELPRYTLKAKRFKDLRD